METFESNGFTIEFEDHADEILRALKNAVDSALCLHLFMEWQKQNGKNINYVMFAVEHLKDPFFRKNVPDAKRISPIKRRKPNVL